MSPSDARAHRLIAVYGDLALRLAGAMVRTSRAAEAIVTSAANACVAAGDWIEFLARVREAGAAWVATHPEDRFPPSEVRFAAHSPDSLDFSILPVDAFSAHDALQRLTENTHTVLLDALVCTGSSEDQAGRIDALAEAIGNLADEIRQGDFPTAEDIP